MGNSPTMEERLRDVNITLQEGIKQMDREQENRRKILAEENERKRLAEENKRKWLAEENLRKRLAEEENERKRLAEENRIKRVAELEEKLEQMTLQLNMVENSKFEVKCDQPLIGTLLEYISDARGLDINLEKGKVFELKELNSSSAEYNRTASKFRRNMKKDEDKNDIYTINKIERIINPYLMLQYNINKLKINKDRITGDVKEEFLYYGTKACFLDKICSENFDWRRYGQSRGNNFGKSVLFSRISYFATRYSDNCFQKVMIVAKVLVGNSCVGGGFTTIPEDPYDTTTNNPREDKPPDAIFKYDDNTFYPQYIIHYCGFDDTKKQGQGRKKWPNKKYTSENAY